MSAWSMSVCALGSRSISSPVPTTSTVVVCAASPRAIGRSIGTALRTSTSWAYGAKPCALIVMWYGFGGRLRKTNWPAESVVAVRLNPLTGLVSSTVTDTITPPVGSFTVPCTVPEPPSCASAGSARDRKITVAKLVVIFVLMIDAPWASWRPLIVRTRTRRHQTRCDEAAFNGLVIGAGARQEERAQERA